MTETAVERRSDLEFVDQKTASALLRRSIVMKVSASQRTARWYHCYCAENPKGLKGVSNWMPDVLLQYVNMQAATTRHLLAVNHSCFH